MEFTQGERGRNDDDDDREEPSNPHQHPPSSSIAFPWRDDRRELGASGSSVAGSSSAGGASENLNYSSNYQQVEKEHMFDKVVTPSDVGKLNRLVIPKQHAEKYFPLDSSTNEKGMQLSFEDRNGKPWRFRYSYWNSSQSYVMTKGWSRFVKEKRLDAGDTVSFGRGVGEAKSRLFIDWKRRPDHRESQIAYPRIPMAGGVSFGRSVGPWGGRFYSAPVYDQNYFNFAYNAANSAGSTVQYHYFRSPSSPMRPPAMQFAPQQPRPPGGGFPVVLNSVPVNNNQAAGSKRVRLFGVNLDCPESDSEPVVRGHDFRNNNLQQYQASSSSNTLQLIELHHNSNNGGESSGASSSSTSKEQQNSALDLDL